MEIVYSKMKPGDSQYTLGAIHASALLWLISAHHNTVGQKINTRGVGVIFMCITKRLEMFFCRVCMWGGKGMCIMDMGCFQIVHR